MLMPVPKRMVFVAPAIWAKETKGSQNGVVGVTHEGCVAIHIGVERQGLDPLPLQRSQRLHRTYAAQGGITAIHDGEALDGLESIQGARLPSERPQRPQAAATKRPWWDREILTGEGAPET